MMETYSLPGKLIDLFEKDTAVGWAVKDTNSNFVYVNKAFKVWQTISPSWNYEGLKISEIPVPVAEFADIFFQQERNIEKTGEAVKAITTHIQGREKILQPAYNAQEPLFDENNKCVGTLISVRSIKIVTPGSLLTGKINQHVTFQAPSVFFTEKEWEVIYLLYCNLRAKEISKVLGITVDAVNGRLRSCYKKASVNTLSSLIEFCKNSGMDNYIPLFFLKKGHIIISRG